MKKIKWIFFDIGGVIRDEKNYDTWRRQALMFHAKKIKPEITEQNFDKAQIEASKISGWLNQNILEILIGDRETAEQIRNELNFEKEMVLRSLPIRPDALKVVGELSKKYFLAVISNQPKKIKDWLKAEGLFDYFKIMGISGDYNLQKPDPEFFKAVLKDAKAKFEESAMIDDNIERSLDVAKNLGMTTVFFNSTNRQNIPKNIVDFTIYSLTDLLNIF